MNEPEPGSPAWHKAKYEESERRSRDLEASRLFQVLTARDLLRGWWLAKPGPIARLFGKIYRSCFVKGSRIATAVRRVLPWCDPPLPSLLGFHGHRLDRFLDRRERLVLPRGGECLVVLPVAAPEYTFAALSALAALPDFQEVQATVALAGLVKDPRLDELLAACDGLGSVEDLERADFDYVLLLRGDAVVEPGAITAAIKAIRDGATAVRGPVVLPNGRLANRGGDPLAPPNQYRKKMTNTGGTFLLKRGPFDGNTIIPKGIEGLVYEPAAAVTILEPRRSDRKRLKAVDDGAKRVLVVDDVVPHLHLGRGYPRANAILRALAGEGCRVTFLATMDDERRESWAEVRSDLPPEVEVFHHQGKDGLLRLLVSRRFEIILVSRPHNMRQFQRIRAEYPSLTSASRVLYDAEALFTLREARRLALRGEPASPEFLRGMMRDELRIAEGTSGILTVSERERSHFIEHGFKQAVTLNHSVEMVPTSAGFGQRSGLLFVASIRPNEPNEDAILWFLGEIWPLLRKAVPGITLDIVGQMESTPVRLLAGTAVRVHGPVDDLRPFYERAKAFIAPTRFSAGIPLKLVETAAYGVPIVATGQLSEQLAWEPGRDMLTADEPSAFADQVKRLLDDEGLWIRLRASALDRVRGEYSAVAFRSTVRQLLKAA